MDFLNFMLIEKKNRKGKKKDGKGEVEEASSEEAKDASEEIVKEESVAEETLTSGMTLKLPYLKIPSYSSSMWRECDPWKWFTLKLNEEIKLRVCPIQYWRDE